MRDSDIREAVRHRLYKAHAGEPATRIVEEMGIWAGTVRIDLAVINGRLWGYEIKSDNDTLERLPYQIEIYSKVFDRVTLVVAGRHLHKALGLIPIWWGCVVASMKGEAVTLKPQRRARLNPTPDPEIIVQMLWKEEAVAVLEEYGLASGWRSKRAGEISARLVSELSFRDLTNSVRKALKTREKLGQLLTCEFNMPVDAVADPTGGASRRS